MASLPENHRISVLAAMRHSAAKLEEQARGASQQLENRRVLKRILTPYNYSFGGDISQPPPDVLDEEKSGTQKGINDTATQDSSKSPHTYEKDTSHHSLVAASAPTGNAVEFRHSLARGDKTIIDSDQHPQSIAQSPHSSVEVKAGNSTLRIPDGARLTGAIPEFQGVLPPHGNLVRGQNVTRVSYALYKIVRLFGFRSMIDSPAGSHAEWMAQTVQRIEFDVPYFKYWGVDVNSTLLRAVRNEIGASASAEFKISDGTSELPDTIDVLFHWTELDASEKDPRSPQYPQYIDKIVREGQRANISYVIFGQFPRLRGPAPAYRNGRWLFLGDATEEPFLYNSYIRGVVPVMASTQPYVLYMTFYSLRSLPH